MATLLPSLAQAELVIETELGGAATNGDPNRRNQNSFFEQQIRVALSGANVGGEVQVGYFLSEVRGIVDDPTNADAFGPGVQFLNTYLAGWGRLAVGPADLRIGLGVSLPTADQDALIESEAVQLFEPSAAVSRGFGHRDPWMARAGVLGVIPRVNLNVNLIDVLRLRVGVSGFLLEPVLDGVGIFGAAAMPAWEPRRILGAQVRPELTYMMPLVPAPKSPKLLFGVLYHQTIFYQEGSNFRTQDGASVTGFDDVVNQVAVEPFFGVEFLGLEVTARFNFNLGDPIGTSLVDDSTWFAGRLLASLTLPVLD